MATENALSDLPGDLVTDFVTNKQLIHRLGAMDDIVATVLFLCSADGGYPLSA